MTVNTIWNRISRINLLQASPPFPVSKSTIGPILEFQFLLLESSILKVLSKTELVGTS
jgi:hypothetical protein